MPERVVVIGGTSGIGLAAARRFAASGREVVIAGRDPDKLTKALQDVGGGASGQSVDARDTEGLKDFFAAIGPVDHVVVTVTGAAGPTPFRELTGPVLREGMENKLLAHAAVARAALPTLRGDGSLTLVSAASAGAAIPATAGLAAVNAAVEAMIPVLAVELAPRRVNAVSPGVVDTAWWDFLDARARREAFAGFAAGTPVGRIGTPDDIASAIAYLVDNTFTTGVVLRVDGGARFGSAA